MILPQSKLKNSLDVIPAKASNPALLKKFWTPLSAGVTLYSVLQLSP